MSDVHVYVVDGRKSGEALGEQTHKVQVVVVGVEFNYHPSGYHLGCMPEDMAREVAQKVAVELGVTPENHPLYS